MIKVLMIGGPADGRVVEVRGKNVRTIKIAGLSRMDLSAPADVPPPDPIEAVEYTVKAIPCGHASAYYVAHVHGADPIGSMVKAYRDLNGDKYDIIEPSFL